MKSESIKSLAPALRKAQEEIGEVYFDSFNPFYKSKYATLGAVIRASKKALAKNSLTISQPTFANENGVGVTTILMHDSGEWIESTVTAPVEGKNLAQEAGKNITYLRRYSLASILGIYSEEDTDAQEPTAGMNLATAKNVVGGTDKKRYGDCTDKELKGKVEGIKKALNNPETSPTRKEELKYKLDAAVTILNSRK